MIIVVGDIHGRFNHLNALINRKRPEIVLQVGDFGYWPGMQNKSKPKSEESVIYFCDGNHEDHVKLQEIENNEIYKNVYYMKRGSTIDLPDGRTVLFMGGAMSFDWMYRTPGLDWFPELELVSDSDLDNLPDKKIDIVISHTAPCEFYTGFPASDDPSRKKLSYILKKYEPKEWYFGHYHFYDSGLDYGCKWTCLADIESMMTCFVSIDKNEY